MNPYKHVANSMPNVSSNGLCPGGTHVMRMINCFEFNIANSGRQMIFIKDVTKIPYPQTTPVWLRYLIDDWLIDIPQSPSCARIFLCKNVFLRVWRHVHLFDYKCRCGFLANPTNYRAICRVITEALGSLCAICPFKPGPLAKDKCY